MASEIPKTRTLVSDEEAQGLRNFIRGAEFMDGRIAGARVARPEDATALAEFLSHESIGPRIYTMPNPINVETIRAFIDEAMSNSGRTGLPPSSVARCVLNGKGGASVAHAGLRRWNGASIGSALIASAKRPPATMNDPSVFFHDWASCRWAR